MFCIYKLTNPHNQLEYVGYTDNLERRAYQHRRDLTVGCTDFEVGIVFDGIPTRAEAQEMEKVFIDVYGTFDNGYNKTRGGSRRTEVSQGTRKLIAEINHKRIQDGTHNFLGDKCQERQREIASASARKRVADGTHNFLGSAGSENNRRRVENGTHNFLGSETNRKRIQDGTHHFLGDNHPIKQLAKEGRHPRTIKKLKTEWMWVRSLAMCWYEMHDYVMARRSEFYDKDISDTSQAEQIKIF